MTGELVSGDVETSVTLALKKLNYVVSKHPLVDSSSMSKNDQILRFILIRKPIDWNISYSIVYVVPRCPTVF